jgi:hypothetical protein
VGWSSKHSCAHLDISKGSLFQRQGHLEVPQRLFASQRIQGRLFVHKLRYPIVRNNNNNNNIYVVD